MGGGGVEELTSKLFQPLTKLKLTLELSLAILSILPITIHILGVHDLLKLVHAHSEESNWNFQNILGTVRKLSDPLRGRWLKDYVRLRGEGGWGVHQITKLANQYAKDQRKSRFLLVKQIFSRGTRAQHLTLCVWCVCDVCVCGVPWMDAMLQSVREER